MNNKPSLTPNSTPRFERTTDHHTLNKKPAQQYLTRLKDGEYLAHTLARINELNSIKDK